MSERALPRLCIITESTVVAGESEMHHTLIPVRKAPCQHFPGGFPLIGSCCKEVSSVVIKTDYSQKLTLFQGFSLCAPPCLDKYSVHSTYLTLSTSIPLLCAADFQSLRFHCDQLQLLSSAEHFLHVIPQAMVYSQNLTKPWRSHRSH